MKLQIKILLTFWSIVIIAIVSVAIYIVHRAIKDKVYIFPNINGPFTSTQIKNPPFSEWQHYSNGSSNRLAVLLTDTDSAWLGIVHGLKSIGVPFILTTDYRIALKHRVVMVYPTLSGKVLDKAALQALAQFPASGGTLIGQNVLGGGLNDVFGFNDAVLVNDCTELKFNTNQSLVASFTDSKEKIIRFSANGVKNGSYKYSNPRQIPLAEYEDGSAAITQKSVGRGHAYAIGIDIGALLLKGYNNREEGISRSYVNGFEPCLDVLLRLIKNIYITDDPDAITIASVPMNKSLAVLLTHDIDYTRSLYNAIKYSELESRFNIKATYFMQTKYVRDWNDDVFFTADGIPLLNKISALGMEIGSHSVAHSRTFNIFPLGTGTESYPSYVPFVKEKYLTKNGSILGELRVSKFLIEKFTHQTVMSFRPGHLSNPYSLPQALVATGYYFSSSVTANNSLTHLPFQLNQGRDVKSEVNIFEFPITIEDEAFPLLGDRIQAAIDLSHKIARYGGMCVVLIHPDIVGHKFDFERHFIESIKGYSWFGSLSDYGTWWSARNNIELDVQRNKKLHVITLNAPDKITGLTLELPADWRFTKVTPSNINVSQTANKVIFGEIKGIITLTLVSR